MNPQNWLLQPGQHRYLPLPRTPCFPRFFRTKEGGNPTEDQQGQPLIDWPATGEEMAPGGYCGLEELVGLAPWNLVGEEKCKPAAWYPAS